MKRCLLVSPTGVAGGAERALAGLAQGLSKLGIETRGVLLQRGQAELWLNEAGCDVTIIEVPRVRRIDRLATAVSRIARQARGVDFVVSNHAKGHVIGGLAARLAHRPAIWWQHGMAGRSAMDRAASCVPAAAVVAGSASSVDAQRRLTPRRRVELIHPGVDLAAVRAKRGEGERLRKTNGWSGRTVVGIVGRLQEWKGQAVFLRAAASVAAVHPETSFVVVGGAVLGWEGDYPDRLHRLAADLGLGDRVHFAGHQCDVYPWFDAMDVVVHASLGEPFGLVVVEAMALGKVVVATRDGGPGELIEHRRSGLLVPPGDHHAMAAAITDVLQTPELRASLEAEASHRAENFDVASMAGRFHNLLQDVTT